MFEKKKARAGGSKTQKKRKVDVKEIQLKANITDHDLQTKVNSIDRFLERGDKVKIIVRLKGRERDNPQRAQDLIEKVISLVTIENKASRSETPLAMAILEPGGVK